MKSHFANSFRIVQEAICIGMSSQSSQGVKLPFEQPFDETCTKYVQIQDGNEPRLVRVASRKTSKFRCAVFFEVAQLEFSGEKIEGLDIRPGGRWYNNHPFWQHQARDSEKRLEIWTLRHNHRCLLADSQGKLRLLQMSGKELSLTVPSIEFLCEYFIRECNLLEKYRRTDWALRNLVLLSKLYCPPHVQACMQNTRIKLGRLRTK